MVKIIRKIMRSALAGTCVQSVVLLGASTGLMWSPGAGAQDAPAAPAAAPEVLETVTVTGTHIRSKDFQTNSPTVTVGSDLFEDTTSIGVETTLNQLPQFVPSNSEFTTTNTQNSALSTTGISTVSLRGLGSNRTLVLIDGRRAMPANAQMVVDTNSIPSAAVQRVEVVTGGESAIYGADAVAGVVNFILKNNFQGFQLQAQSGITQQGDGLNYRFSPLFGANLADGRGNVMFGLTYDKREAVWDRDRHYNRDDWADKSIGGGANWQVDPFVAGSPDTNIDWNGDGIVANSETDFPSQAAVNALFSNPPNGQVGNNSVWSVAPNGTVYTGTFSLLPGGNNPAGAYRWPGQQNGGYVYRDGVVFQKQTNDGIIRENVIDEMTRSPLTRYSAFGRARYELTDSITTTAQLLYTNTSTTSVTDYAPAARSWSIDVPHGNGIYDGTVVMNGVPVKLYPNSVNPDGTTQAFYLPGGRFGLNCPARGGCTNSQVFPLPPELSALMDSRVGNRPTTANPEIGANMPVNIGRALDFVPPRTNVNQLQTFQFVVGLEGKLPIRDWTWDTSLSYGQNNTEILQSNYVNLAQYRAIALSPNFGHGAQITGNIDGGGLESGVGTCTSGLPIFGGGQPTQDCLNAIDTNATSTSLMKQTVLEANLNGTLFDLPAGGLSGALGYQYRKNTYSFIDDFVGDQYDFTNQLVGLFPVGSSQGSIHSNEVYGEVLVPIIGHLPLIQQLSLDLSARYSDYSTIGNVVTYGALMSWNITHFARIRGGYEKANRAPNIAELFLARTQMSGFEQYGDQCSQNNIGPVSPNPSAGVSAQQVAQSLALCNALMGNVGSASYYSTAIPLQPRSRGRQISTTNAIGNPNVKDEQANTITAGLVLESPWSNRWVKDLTTTFDWYDIKINGIIALGSQDGTYSECLSLSTNPTGDPNAPACQRIHRDPSTGGLLPTDVTFTNEGRVHTQGVDVQINWNMPELGFMPGRFMLNIQGNILTKYMTQQAPGLPENDWVGTNGTALDLDGGAYRWRTFTRLSYTLNRATVGVTWRHLPAIQASSLADCSGVGCPSQANLNFLPIKRYDLFDMTGNFRVSKQLQFRGGVQNVFDIVPPRGPIDLTQTLPNAAHTGGTGGGEYDLLGRRFFLGFTWEPTAQ